MARGSRLSSNPKTLASRRPPDAAAGGGSDATARDECAKYFLMISKAGNCYQRPLRLIKQAVSRYGGLDSSPPLLLRVCALANKLQALQLQDPKLFKRHMEEALKASSRACAVVPDSSTLSLFHAEILHEADDYNKVIAECERGMQIEHPADPALHSFDKHVDAQDIHRQLSALLKKTRELKDRKELTALESELASQEFERQQMRENLSKDPLLEQHIRALEEMSVDELLKEANEMNDLTELTDDLGNQKACEMLSLNKDSTATSPLLEPRIRPGEEQTNFMEEDSKKGYETLKSEGKTIEMGIALKQMQQQGALASSSTATATATSPLLEARIRAGEEQSNFMEEDSRKGYETLKAEGKTIEMGIALKQMQQEGALASSSTATATATPILGPHNRSGEEQYSCLDANMPTFKHTDQTLSSSATAAAIPLPELPGDQALLSPPAATYLGDGGNEEPITYPCDSSWTNKSSSYVEAVLSDGSCAMITPPDTVCSEDDGDNEDSSGKSEMTDDPVDIDDIRVAPETAWSEDGLDFENCLLEDVHKSLGISNGKKVHGAGLKNSFDDLNCFLNVIIQALWNLRRFRDMLLKTSSMHEHIGDPCVVCALRGVFIALDEVYGKQGAAVEPISLRIALSNYSSNEELFKEGQSNDAYELLTVLLQCLHESYTSPSCAGYSDISLDSNGTDSWDCANKDCVAHNFFGINVLKQLVCYKCGLVSHRSKCTLFVQTVYVRQLICAMMIHPGSPFDDLLKIGIMSDGLTCDGDIGGCGKFSSMHDSVLSPPPVFAIGLVWPIAEDLLSQFLAVVSTEIDMSAIYNGQLQGSKRSLVSMICFAGMHYICFALECGEWVLYDDQTVEAIGDWINVLNRCEEGNWKPTLLLFGDAQ